MWAATLGLSGLGKCKKTSSFPLEGTVFSGESRLSEFEQAEALWDFTVFSAGPILRCSPRAVGL